MDFSPEKIDTRHENHHSKHFSSFIKEIHFRFVIYERVFAISKLNKKIDINHISSKGKIWNKMTSS